MGQLSDAHHFRKLVAGACMVLSPLFLVIAMVIHPETKSDEAAQIAVIADNLDAWYIAHLLTFAAVVLAVPAVLGLMHMLREREVAWGHIGGGLALLGLMAFTGLLAIDGFVGWQMAADGSRAEMAALLERLYDTAGVAIPFYVMSFAFTIGIVCLAFGLYQAKAMQSWMAVFLALGVLLLAASSFGELNWIAIVGAAFLLVGLGSIGRMVLAESDEDWEHTPEYSGFRPLHGMR